MWALSSICTMLAPFYVAYVPFVNFLVRGEHLQKRTALKYLTVVPVIIFIIIFADFFFVTQGVLAPICIFIINILIQTIALFIFLVMFCNNLWVKKVMMKGLLSHNSVESLYHKFNSTFFGMSKNDSKGQRS